MRHAPALREHWKNNHRDLLDDYRYGRRDFLPWLMPEQAIGLPDKLVDQLLRDRFGPAYDSALDPEQTTPSPVADQTDPQWLQESNMVGINIRTIGGYWDVIKYALTLPPQQDSIHLLPIWEPGVVSSLYGMAGWQLNPAFFSRSWQEHQPHLHTVEKQLKVCINLLHLMGKTVGLDVIPHTDRYSEIVLANPAYFEWLWRQHDRIADHRAELHVEVEKSIHAWLTHHGAAENSTKPLPEDAEALYRHIPETERMQLLFGSPENRQGRLHRRIGLVDHLYRLGFEPVPATMGPPYRGLEVDPNPEARTTDEAGRIWYDYRITQPQSMSRVFGPLTRYKLYERLEDNRHWQIDFSRPRTEVWEYVRDQFASICNTYPFDFMRGDMSHVQMRPEGVPKKPGPYYDLHGYLRQHLRTIRPWFGYFAESFLAPPNTMAYGSEPEHLEASEADSTLGNLQSLVFGSLPFLQEFSWYLQLRRKHHFAPSFTIMTADKDDPRFDQFYRDGNEARLFISLFLPELPSYMGLGFECRDIHQVAVPNEHYTKLYVFHIEHGPKATRGPFRWGKDELLFYRVNRIRLAATECWPQMAGKKTHWWQEPGADQPDRLLAWSVGSFLFLVNADLQRPHYAKVIPELRLQKARMQFSTHRELRQELTCSEQGLMTPNLLPGESVIIDINN